MTDRQDLQRTITRLNERAWGFSLGLLSGTGLFVATVILVIRGGPNVGQHLSLLKVYFPGYSVSWFGAFVGFVYAFVVGYGLGRFVGGLYNRLTSTR